MKAYLMHRDADVDLDATPVWNEQDLTGDLEIDTVLAAMAGGDPFLADVARRTLLAGLHDPEAIRYRQDVLADFLAQPAVLNEMYTVAVEAITGERQVYPGSLFRSPEITLHRSVQVLTLFRPLLSRLRAVADTHGDSVRSEGLTRFLRMLTEELDDAYFREVDDHLRRLAFGNGVLISAGLGAGLAGTDHTLRKPAVDTRRWFERLLAQGPPSFTYTVPDRDEGGFRALGELRVRGIDLVADALAQSTEHILAFFRMLRTELGFYLACVNLHDQLVARGNPTCFPVPATTGLTVVCEGLYDPSLALTTDQSVVGNDVDARDGRLIVVTGANQGGKSTFLRSVGLTQLMAQAGMFAPARALQMSLSTGVFTHCRREEDATMTSGKLDEELTRMSAVVDHLTPGALMLSNESFAATNEREGSQIARAILQALIEAGIHVVVVTHLYDLAHRLYIDRTPGAVFLRAPRTDDGRRTFHLEPGEPLPTSYGKDVFRQVFGTDAGLPDTPGTSATHHPQPGE